MDLKVKEELIRMFEGYFKKEMTAFEVLPPSGSYRQYCRIKSENHQAIGTWNQDVQENLAFLKFSEHFFKQSIAVPEIYAVNGAKTCYLQEDLGTVTLFDYITLVREQEGFSEKIISIYKKILIELPKIQITAGQGIDYGYCYPRAAFDKQSMMWDLNYFKYYFLKLARIHFDEQALEDDFESFTNFLLEADGGFFLFRDFQSRNMMLINDRVAFIDYQGGRKGALQYDLASLLYDAKADIPQAIRNELLEFYLDTVEKQLPVDREKFKAFYTGYVLIRIMQAMGAYGFRGFYEKKEHFLKSIPYALENLKYILQNNDIPVPLPELFRVLDAVTRSEYLKQIDTPKNTLTVRVGSFSYKKGLPDDPSGNGGGFIFDCRAIHNPGRYDEFKPLTGKDPEVIGFLETKSEIADFLTHVLALADQSVKTYLARGFKHLSIYFGCTGGQHRSVYAAEKTAEHLRNNFPVDVVLSHRELGNLERQYGKDSV